MSMAISFRDLRIWQKGFKLLNEVYEVTKKFPDEEKFCITQQIRKSANLIIANIAEAHGRFYYKDKIRVIYISRGELEETRSHLLVAKGLGYVSDEKWEYSKKEYEGLLIVINEYIGALSNKS